MRLARHLTSLALCLLGLASGCATSEHVARSNGSTGVNAGGGALSGASMKERGKIEVDVSALTSTADIDRLSNAGTAGEAGYLSVSAADCQCLAAASSSLANLIELERGIGACTDRHCLSRKKACAADMRDDLLALRAMDERNRAAGAALELYYRLAEAEAGLDVLAESQEAVDHALANISELKKSGLKVDVDESTLARRKLELFDQQAEAELARDQSRGGLKVLLGQADDDATQLWPAADLTAAVEPVDVESAVSEGLASRAELIILRCLSESLSVQTLPGARSALQQRDSSLGSSSLDMRKLHALLGGARNAAELETRRTQIAMLLADRERTIAQEIRGAAAAVTTRLKQATIAKLALEGRQEHLEELERKREVGSATPFDVAAEKLEIVKAEGELMRRLIAWRIAQVKLKQAQGVLATECGYLHTPCCGTCGRRSCRAGGACQHCNSQVSGSQPASDGVSPISKLAAGTRVVRIGEPGNKKSVSTPRQAIAVHSTAERSPDPRGRNNPWVALTAWQSP